MIQLESRVHYSTSHLKIFAQFVELKCIGFADIVNEEDMLL